MLQKSRVEKFISDEVMYTDDIHAFQADHSITHKSKNEQLLTYTRPRRTKAVNVGYP